MNFIKKLFHKLTNKINKKTILKENQLVELSDTNGNLIGALLVHSQQTKDKILNYFQGSRNNGYAGHNGKISPYLVHTLISASPIVAAALQKGFLLQPIGPSALLQGLKNGTISLMSTPTGLTGTALSNLTGKIVGQLRFASVGLAKIVIPLALANFITGIMLLYKLKKIDKKLDKLQRSVDYVLMRMKGESYGRLLAIFKTLQEIDTKYRTIGSFSDDMTISLSICSYEIKRLFSEEECLFNISKSNAEKIIIIKEGDANAAKTIKQFLEEEENSSKFDANLYYMASIASLISEKLWLAHDLEKTPEYLSIRNNIVEYEIKQFEQVEKDIRMFMKDFEKLYNKLETYIENTNWLSRYIFHKGLCNEIKKMLTDKHNEPSFNESQETIPSILIWQDKDQKLNCVNIECKIE